MPPNETKPQTPLLISNSILAVLLLLITLWASQLVQQLHQRQVTRSDLAELNGIQYGMLNVDIWVQNLSAIMDKKIREFEFNEQNRDAAKATLERMLDTLITEADAYMRKQNTTGNWWKRTTGSIKQGLQDIFVDIEDVKSAIPQYADRILDELDTDEGRAELHRFLTHMLSELSRASFAELDSSALDEIFQRYHCEERQFCHGILQNRIQQLEASARLQASAILIAIALCFVLVAMNRQNGPANHAQLRLLALSWCATALLACGVLTPMIEVEARISSLHFVLLDEPVRFQDQVLYFQSKSILNVVQVLTATGELDMILVGVLIMSFSVIFPISKLLATLVYVYDWRSWRNNKLIRFFALKSGKWSMADVMVVAIFMAYIGFDGLVSSQLAHFSDAQQSNIDVLSTNGTSLQLGFFMFLAFCLSSLLASTLIEQSEPAPDALTAPA